MSNRSFALPRRAAALAVVVFASLGVTAATAPAANQQGLVNVDLSNNVIQVPIGVAANICGVNAAVLSAGTVTGSQVCTAVARPSANAGGGGNGGSGGNQRGLVNVTVANNTIQVPIAVAANVCGVSVAVLSTGTFTSPDLCRAVTPATATG